VQLVTKGDMCLTPKMLGGVNLGPCAFAGGWTVEKDKKIRSTNGACLVANTKSGSFDLRSDCKLRRDEQFASLRNGHIVAGWGLCLTSAGDVRKGRRPCTDVRTVRFWKIGLSSAAPSGALFGVQPEVAAYATTLVLTFLALGLSFVTRRPGPKVKLASAPTVTRTPRSPMVDVKCEATGSGENPARVVFRVL